MVHSHPAAGPAAKGCCRNNHGNQNTCDRQYLHDEILGMSPFDCAKGTRSAGAPAQPPVNHEFVMCRHTRSSDFLGAV
jgi:hypothetical protein